MQTTKKTYEKPVLRAEQFVPNNYCEMCYYIRCEVPYHTAEENNKVWSELTASSEEHESYTPSSGSWFSTKGNDGFMYENYVDGVNHRASACGTRSKQILQQANNNVGFTMKEWSEEQKKYLDCTSLTIENGIVKWITGGNTWHHWGYRNSVDPTKPNHS